jgi:hypothetical protein
MMRPPETEISDLRHEMRNLVTSAEEEIRLLRSDVTNLRQIVTDQSGSFAEVVNLINNSHPEWSKAAYAAPGVLSNDAGDANLEAHNWYRQLASDTAIATASADALKAAKTSEPADHTLWAANEAANPDIPRYDKVNGTIELGGVTETWDLAVPIPNDVVFPGQVFYVQFEAMLRTADPMPSGLQMEASIFDNTAGQQKIIEGGNFAITDDAGGDPGVTYGIPGSTSVNYKIIAETDSGERTESNVLNFPNAPAVFDEFNHPRIRFSGVPGFIKFEIYREMGGVYELRHVVANTIEGTYFDVGNPPVRVVDGFPSASEDRPRAHAITNNFSPGSLNGNGWIRHALTVLVPTTYNRGVTGSGMQYFRLGPVGATDVPRQVLIRRVGLSMGSGKWARSPEDIRPGVRSAPSTSAVGAGSGSSDPGTGGGGGDIEPPPPPGGGGYCALLSSDLHLPGGETIVLDDAKRGMLVDSGGPVPSRIRRIKKAHASRIFRVVTETGLSIGVTFDHPFIAGWGDIDGTPCIKLKKRLDAGEMVHVLTRRANGIDLERVVSITEESGDFWVGMPTLEGAPYVLINGFLNHNRKAEPGDELFF